MISWVAEWCDAEMSDDLVCDWWDGIWSTLDITYAEAIMGRDGDVRTKAKDGKRTGGGKWERYTNRPVGEALRWADVSPAVISAAVGAVTASGDAILFGRTAAGSTLVATVCSGDERIKFYAGSVAEATQKLEEITATALEDLLG